MPNNFNDLTLLMQTTAEMEYFADKQRQKLPPEQRAIIDMILLASDIKNQTLPPEQIARKLRKTARLYKPFGLFTTRAYMDSIADQLEGKPPPTTN